PITNTAPYAPTSENDCVDLETHADFLVRYYLLALASCVVKNVYWHQLIAPGYGLIDNRENKLVKYPAYTAFKTMLLQLKKSNFVNLKNDNGVYCATFENQDDSKDIKKTEVFWSISDSIDNNQPMNIDTKTQKLITRDGLEQNDTSFKISGSPVYLITQSEHS
ncbi:MAG: hypothetical protein V7749_17160, partial [Cocleimonas sp.]